jgi:DNA-directed RNA polymerase specialized sigma54-like protein
VLYLLYVHIGGWLKPNTACRPGLILQQAEEFILIDAFISYAPQYCKLLIRINHHVIPTRKLTSHYYKLFGYKVTNSI